MRLLAAVVFALVILQGMRFDSISPGKGKEGDVVTVKGDNFGSECEVRLARAYAEVISASPDKIKFKAPHNTKGSKTLMIYCKDRMPIYEIGVFEYTE